MDDKDIVLLFLERDSNGIAKVREKYEKYCYKIAYAIVGNPEDAEECVNDLWLRVWNSIPPQKPDVLKLYLAKIIRHLALDRVKKRNTVRAGNGELFLAIDELEDCIPGKKDVAVEYEAKEMAESVKMFVKTLKTKELRVFLRRYFYADSIADIAARYHLTRNHVTVILTRTRKKLKEHLLKEKLIE